MMTILTHPLATFLAGALIALLLAGCFFNAKGSGNQSAKKVKTYYAAVERAGNDGPAPGTPEEKAALKRFTDFLQNVGNSDYLRDNTAIAYADGAYLDDTIVTHHGPEEIKNYFLQTAETMSSFEVRILDTARSGPDHYIRWEMIFAAPKLANGEPLHSVGVSQVRFNSEGKVAMHQDFWDSGQNLYGHIPVVGGLIELIRNRMK